MSEAFHIISDGSCDLPLELTKEKNITVVPFYVSFEEGKYQKEMVEIGVREFYQKMVDHPDVYPKSSMPSVQDYLDAFLPYVKAGTPIICICITTKFSGSMQSALNAKAILEEEYPESQIYVCDSCVNTVLQGIYVLEAVRQCGSVRSFLNVTTDKVYKNNEWEWGYRETDELDGYDPYSNSKSCSELVTHSYEKSFLKDMDIAVSTARAGNVIGGGDFAADRIIPDCVRAVSGGKKIAVRNPHSTRPYQHVLEPLGAYLLIAEEQYQDSQKAGSYNVGPDDRSCLTTGELADLFCTAWGNGAAWENLCQGGPHEANFLKLDCSRIRNRLGWKPRWQVDEAVVNTAKWYQAWLAGQNMAEYTDCQIKEYFGI